MAQLLIKRVQLDEVHIHSKAVVNKLDEMSSSTLTTNVFLNEKVLFRDKIYTMKVTINNNDSKDIQNYYPIKLKYLLLHISGEPFKDQSSKLTIICLEDNYYITSMKLIKFAIHNIETSQCIIQIIPQSSHVHFIPAFTDILTCIDITMYSNNYLLIKNEKDNNNISNNEVIYDTNHIEIMNRFITSTLSYMSNNNDSNLVDHLTK
jgi:hypothetical protein